MAESWLEILPLQLASPVHERNSGTFGPRPGHHVESSSPAVCFPPMLTKQHIAHDSPREACACELPGQSLFISMFLDWEVSRSSDNPEPKCLVFRQNQRDETSPPGRSRVYPGHFVSLPLVLHLSGCQLLQYALFTSCHWLRCRWTWDFLRARQKTVTDMTARGEN